MKKTTKILLMLLLCAAAFAVTACGEKGGGESHTHEPTAIWSFDTATHWHACTADDGAKLDEAEHAFTEQKSDGTHHWSACLCGATTEKTAHVYAENKHDDTHHWSTCTCGATTEKTRHTLSYTDYGATHDVQCEECSYTASDVAHVFDVPRGDGVYHWDECECGEEEAGSRQKHSYADSQSTECEICGLPRVTVTVTYKDSDDNVIKSVTVGAGETLESVAVYVRYGTVQWTLSGNSEVFDMTTEITSDTVLVEKSGTWTEHDHRYDWRVGTGSDAGKDLGTCVCEKTAELTTVLVPTKEQRSFLDFDDTTALVKTDLLPTGFTVQKIIYGGKDIEHIAVSGGLQIDMTDVYETNKFGEYSLQIVAAGADQAAHTFTLPVTVATKVLKTVADFAAVQATSNATPIKGYYVLGQNIDGNGATVGNSYVGGMGQGAHGFIGTFDGFGFTVGNITVDKMGIFGSIGANAVIQNVCFTGVSLMQGGRDNNKLAPLFAVFGTAFARVENISAQFTQLNPFTGAEQGLLFSRKIEKAGAVQSLIKNVDLQAKGFTLPCALCNEISNITLENVFITAASVTALCYSGGAAVNTLEGVELHLPTKVETLCAAEGEATQVVLTGDIFVAGETYTVSCNNSTKEIEATDAGSLTLTLADFNITALGQYAAAVENGENRYVFTEVWKVTKVLTQWSEFAELGMETTSSVNSGYYIVGNDINDENTTTIGSANMGSMGNGSVGFKGTLNGRGCTIRNVTVDKKGLFGTLGANAVVQNIHFDGVTLNAGGRYDNIYAPLFAVWAYAFNKIENVSVRFTLLYAGAGDECGLLISRETSKGAGLGEITNVMLDATGLTVANALGQSVNATVVFNSVTIKAASVTELGRTTNQTSSSFNEKTGVTVLIAPAA